MTIHRIRVSSCPGARYQNTRPFFQIPENFLLVRGSVKSIVLFTKGDFNNAGQGDLVCRLLLERKKEKDYNCAQLNFTYRCNHRSSGQPLRASSEMQHTLDLSLN